MPTKLKLVIGIWIARLCLELARPLLMQGIKPVAIILFVIFLIGVARGNDFVRSIALSLEALSGLASVVIGIGLLTGGFEVFSYKGYHTASAIASFISAVTAFYCSWCLTRREVRRWMLDYRSMVVHY